MSRSTEDTVWYPTVNDILLIHEDIISEDSAAVSGIQDESRLQYAIDFIKGNLSYDPGTIHDRAFHLMRLIASNHWFVDGNKRTALNVTELFYLINGYELTYGDDLRSVLKLFSVREDLIDRNAGPAYLRDRTNRLELDPDELDAREGLALLLVALIVRYSDMKEDDLGHESELDVASIREEHGLTTDYGTTVNPSDAKESDQDGSEG